MLGGKLQMATSWVSTSKVSQAKPYELIKLSEKEELGF